VTAGGGRTPDSRPDAGWPEQIVSLGDLWRDEAILGALGARRAVPPEALADPAAGLLAALTRDVDAADRGVDPLTDLLAAFTERRGRRQARLSPGTPGFSSRPGL
jgi:hypothetical protein